MRTVVIGGGAAGFFAAVNLKEMMPEMEITIFERNTRVLNKVEISGGGRCNCTNSFAHVGDLQSVYPRGHRLLRRLFKQFGHQEAYQWFETHGVPLVTQDDDCVFPAVQDSHAIIDCFLRLSHRYHIQICHGRKIDRLNELGHYDYAVVTTGGSPRAAGLQWLADMGHETISPVPSLFTFSINDARLTELQGLVVDHVTAHIPGTKLKSTGPLLITHWGMSGPSILKLSSLAARMLAEAGYSMPFTVNWTGMNDNELHEVLCHAAVREPQKQLTTYCPIAVPSRLWTYLLEKALSERSRIRWSDANKKDINRIVNTLTNDNYQIAGRAAFKDEFVTCGGISLNSIHPQTLESRHVPHLYFAGEVLDIDGVTGGFNFQAAWTTAFVVAKAIATDARIR